MNKQRFVEEKIDGIVEKAGYITEKMLIGICVDVNLPDYEIDQLCERVFTRKILVLETPVYVENAIVKKYAQHIQRVDGKNACKILTSVVNFIACFKDEGFESFAKDNNWEEIKKLAQGHSGNGNFSKKYDFETETVLNFVSYYQVLSLKEKREQTQITDEELIFRFLFEHAGFLYSDTIIANTLGIEVEVVDSVLGTASWVFSKWGQYFMPQRKNKGKRNWKEEFIEIKRQQANIDDIKIDDKKLDLNRSNYRMISEMNIFQMAKFIEAVMSGNSLFFERDYEETTCEVDLTNILEWLQRDSVTKRIIIEADDNASNTQAEAEENLFWIWLRKEGFMERVIEQLKEYAENVTNEEGLRLLDLKSRDEIQRFIDFRGKNCPAKERLLYKYYLQYWKLYN